MATIETRDDVIRLLGRSAFRGTLGLFLGTGYSMAVTQNMAPRWTELLSKIARELQRTDPFADLKAIIGMSLPEVASKMVLDYSHDILNNPAYKTKDPLEAYAIAEIAIKDAAAKAVASLQPDEATRRSHCTALHAICPAWVVTTNYDDLFQKTHGKTQTFLPDDVVVTRRGVLPVWHIHGSVLVPSSMVLTQRDYVDHLRPGTYRQSKLAHMMLESTTLMLGYNYGDVNVQTAASISRSDGLLGIEATRRPSDSVVVQVIWKERNPSQDISLGNGGTILLENSDTTELLREIAKETELHSEKQKKANVLIKKCLTSPEKVAELLIKDKTNMEPLTKTLREHPEAYLDDDIIKMLSMLFSEVSKRAYGRGGFAYYSTWLELILTMLLEWDISAMPTSIFALLASELAKVVYYIDPDGKQKIGQSWEATNAWKNRKNEIIERRDLFKALAAYSRREADGGMLNNFLVKIKPSGM